KPTPNATERFWLEEEKVRVSRKELGNVNKGEDTEVAFDSQWEQWLWLNPDGTPWQARWAARDPNRCVVHDPRVSSFEVVWDEPRLTVPQLLRRAKLEGAKQLEDGTYQVEILGPLADIHMILKFDPRRNFRLFYLEYGNKQSKVTSQITSFSEP